MTDKLIDVELYVAMNEDGGWIINTDESEALSQLTEDEGGFHARVVKVTIKMSPPKMAEIAVTVPDDTGKQEAIAA